MEIPEGWKLVPEIVTLEMVKAGQKAYEPNYEYGLVDDDMILVYKAMIAAAPAPPGKDG